MFWGNFIDTKEKFILQRSCVRAILNPKKIYVNI